MDARCRIAACVLPALVAGSLAAQIKVPPPKTPAPLPALPAPRAALPVSSEGLAATRVDLTVSIRHEAPRARECAAASTANGCAAPEHWEVELRQPAHRGVITTDGAHLEKLEPLLFQAATEASVKQGQGEPSPGALLSIRAAPSAPFRLVRQVMEQAAQASITKLELAVSSAGAAPVEQRIPARLPVDGQGSRAEVPVVLVRFENGEVARVFWGRRVATDAELIRIFRDGVADYARRGQDATGVIRADPAMPWQAVIDVVSLFRTAGVHAIEFVRPRPGK